MELIVVMILGAIFTSVLYYGYSTITKESIRTVSVRSKLIKEFQLFQTLRRDITLATVVSGNDRLLACYFPVKTVEYTCSEYGILRTINNAPADTFPVYACRWQYFDYERMTTQDSTRIDSIELIQNEQGLENKFGWKRRSTSGAILNDRGH